MSATNSSAATQFEAELVTFFIAQNATRYLTVSAFVVLVYDHLLLLSEEVNLIWSTKSSWLKRVFYINRYSVPIYILIGCYGNSGLVRVGITNTFCKAWLSLSIILLSISLLINNIFILQRVYALTGYNKTLWMYLVGGCSLTYAAVISVDIYASTLIIPTLSYSSLVNSCVVSKRATITVVPLAIPLAYDSFLFLLVVRNGIKRPTHLRTTLVRQLHVEGTLYFLLTIGLRLMNIVVILHANIAYSTFALYFFWATINAALNRMLITLSSLAASTPRVEQAIKLNADETQLELEKFNRDSEDMSHIGPSSLEIRNSELLDMDGHVYNLAPEEADTGITIADYPLEDRARSFRLHTVEEEEFEVEGVSLRSRGSMGPQALAYIRTLR